MGNILAFIRQIRDGSFSGADLDDKYGVFLDLENENLDFSVLDEREKALAEKIETKLKAAYQLLEFLQNYGSGGRQIIKEASANTSDESVQTNAWNRLVPMVASLLQLKKMTDSLNEEVPELLSNMWDQKVSRESLALIDMFRKNMFLVVQLGKILDYAMRFDALKMNAPTIPNDISYVKRQNTIRSKRSSISCNPDHREVLATHNLEQLSMYYILPTPALKNIIDTVTNFFKNDNSKETSLDLIVSFGKICIKILSSDLKSKYQRFGTIGMIQRMMVASALLYDHLHPDGVFVKDSPINIRAVVDLLLDEAGMTKKRTRSHSGLGNQRRRAVSQTSVDRIRREQNRQSLQDLQDESRNLLSVLKYSNKHLRSETTPKSVEQLFAGIF